jgi:hypothetical protein
MKINICDVCAKEKRIVIAGWRRKFPSGLALQMCAEHKGAKMEQEEAFKVVMEAEQVIRAMERNGVAG